MAKDPYQYFRIEARELHDALVRGVLDYEKQEVDGKEDISRLLRMAHTLKGAARVVKQVEISQHAHAIEDVLAPYRGSGERISQQKVGLVLGLLDKIEVCLEALRGPQAKVDAPLSAQAASDDAFEVIRLNIGEMDELLDGLTAGSSQVRALKPYVDTLRGMLTLSRRRGELRQSNDMFDELAQTLDHLCRALPVHIERAEREISTLKERARQFRLLPASSLFDSLQRSIRDACETSNKQVAFETAGGETRIDAHILRELKNALLHIVRNAVAHGVESTAERVATGKVPKGLIQVSIERRGNRVAFVCKDDGRGIDVDAIRSTAVANGLISASEASSLDLEKAIPLILQGGISTTRLPNELSGRGIGLDMVASTVAKVKGNLTIRSIPAQGTTVEIVVPVSMESLWVLKLKADERTVSVPFDAVVQTLRVSKERIARTEEGEALVLEGQAVKLLSLTHVLNGNLAPTRGLGLRTVLVLGEPSKRIALSVEEILGMEEVVMRPLPKSLESAYVAGCFFDMDGNPQLILNPVGLIEHDQAVAFHSDVASETKKRILVVDDSLTIRMLEQNILEAAGYEVVSANSGEEGLETARKTPCLLFIVDVEMPGMDGFSFISQTKKDPALAEIPAILVTSRALPADLERGKQVGAYAHVVKSEFDEHTFLKTIRELIG